MLADRGVRATLSYAGRVNAPKDQPVPCRIGGFGGVPGLVAYLKEEAITHVVDATHPFAERMSLNAIQAAAETNIPLMALTRPPWQPGDGDRWQSVPDIDAAIQALAGPAKRVFLAIGRQNLDAFAKAPRHHYCLRLVDPPTTPPPFPSHEVIVARGPFSLEGDLALMKERRIDLVVSKNAGGMGARAKLEAARTLGLPVLMIERPVLPVRKEVDEPEAVLDWLAHADIDSSRTASSGTDLGV